MVVLLASQYQRPAPALWVEVHDLSPGYRLENIERALDAVQGRAERVVLLVIPARGGVENISGAPAFVSFLRREVQRGAVVGMHGYSHEGVEFFTSGARAERLIEMGRREMERAGVVPEVFYPPRYLMTPWSLEVARREFGEVALFTRVVRGDESLPYMSHDFTTPLLQGLFFRLSELSLLLSGSEVYRVSIHPAYLDGRAIERLGALMRLGGFRAERYSCSEGELRRAAEVLEPPAELRGTKRKAYALLYYSSMYAATGEERYLRRAQPLAGALLGAGDYLGWGEEEGVPESSYALLETAAAVWALSEAYLRGVIGGREAERGIIRGGDALLRKLEVLSSFTYAFGLKPNAIGYAALALERASRAADAMGEHERAVRYRRKAAEVGRGLLKMQEKSGAWRDGPYRLARDWRKVSTAYQSMALSGLVAGYASTPPGERGRLRAGVVAGLEFLTSLKRGEGYYGVLYPNGTLAGDGTAIAAQAFAIAKSYGFPAPCAPPPESTAWDPNLAFATSRMLELATAPRRPPGHGR